MAENCMETHRTQKSQKKGHGWAKLEKINTGCK